jgi:hypothetical protein
MEAETLAAEERERLRLEQLEAERRQQRWEEAMERARARHIEHHRADILADQVARWDRATSIRAYCDAIEQAHSDDGSAVEWIAWARAHADHIDPLDPPPTLPDPPSDVTAEDLQPFLDGWSAYGPEPYRGRWSCLAELGYES